MSDVLLASISGCGIDLVEPATSEVDFYDIAETLARINRFNGCARSPVSVAQHSLISADCALQMIGDDTLRPWMLLHDAHEARTGDIASPIVSALVAIADREFDGKGYRPGYIVKSAIKTMKHIHDVAIYGAANLPMPTAAQKTLIRAADVAALLTERRDFCSPPRFNLDHETENAVPLNRQQRLMPPDEAADRLYREFRRWLPRYAEMRRSA